MIGALKWMFLVCSLLMMGCSPSLDVVGKGPFQKRKYLPGWHVEVPQKRSVEQPSTTANRARSRAERIEMPAPTNAERPLSATTGPIALMPPAPSSLPGHSNAAEWEPVAASGEQLMLIPPDRDELPLVRTPGQETGTSPDEPTLRRWNRMALVSGVFLLLSIAVIAISGGGSILGYLLSFSFITGVIGLLLAIKHKEKGKGIAIAAIAFPVVLLALVIAALNTVW